MPSLIDEFDLSGRSALITGSTLGIGFAIAEALAGSGARVVLNGIESEEAAQPSVNALKATGNDAWYCREDLTLPRAGQRLFDAATAKAGPLDILISSGSVQCERDFFDVEEAEIDRQFAANYKASFQLIQLALGSMIKRGWGRIITIGSVQEEIYNPNFAVYASLKKAQTHFLLNLAKNYGKGGITLNNIAPGGFDTLRNRDMLSDPEKRDKLVSRIPSGRIGQPKDCAGAALLLCSEAGSYINGASLPIDGGLRL